MLCNICTCAFIASERPIEIVENSLKTDIGFLFFLPISCLPFIILINSLGSAISFPHFLHVSTFSGSYIGMVQSNNISRVFHATSFFRVKYCFKFSESLLL